MAGHVAPKSLYYTIFGALMVLTILTVEVATHNFGVLNFPVAIGIAITKATLVILFFMHAKYSSSLTKLFVGTAFFFLAIMLGVARPTVKLDAGRERVIEWPSVAFRYGSMDGSREIVTGCGIEPHLRWRRFCDLIAELAATLGVRRVVLLGAFLADVVYSRPVGVTGFASDPRVLERIGVPVSSYQGPTGILGVISDRLRREGLEIVSLWAGLPHYISAAPNPRGALALLGKLGELLDLKLDDEPLRREAALFEEKVSALVAADPELSEYVRQLKRRDFAQ